MELEGFTSLPECSRKAQTTVDRARYWLKLLGINIIKKGNVRYVQNSAINLLGNMARLVSNGITPSEAVKKTKAETPSEIIKAPSNTLQDNRLDGIEKAMLAMADQMKIMVEENRTLRLEVSNLQKALTFSNLQPVQEEKPLQSQKENARADPRQVKNWQPEIRENPLQGKPWYEKAFIKIFKPEELRRHEN